MPDHSKIREVIRNSLPYNYDYAKAAANQGGPPITSSESETKYRYCTKDNCAGYALAALGAPHPYTEPVTPEGTTAPEIIARFPAEWKERYIGDYRGFVAMDSLQVKAVLEDMAKKGEDGIIELPDHVVAITYKNGRLNWNQSPDDTMDEFTLNRKKTKTIENIRGFPFHQHKHLIRNYDVTAEPWFRKLYPGSKGKIYGIIRIKKP